MARARQKATVRSQFSPSSVGIWDFTLSADPTHWPGSFFEFGWRKYLKSEYFFKFCFVSVWAIAFFFFLFQNIHSLTFLNLMISLIIKSFIAIQT